MKLIESLSSLKLNETDSVQIGVFLKPYFASSICLKTSANALYGENLIIDHCEGNKNTLGYLSTPSNSIYATFD